MNRSTPRTTADLTPTWLTEALQAAGALSADTSVAHVRFERLNPEASLACLVVRASLTYRGREAGPASVVCKLPATDRTERAGGFKSGLYANEVRFYSELAFKSALKSPACLHAAIDPARQGLAIVLEDLGKSTGVGDSEPTEDQVSAAARALARMHGTWWDSPALAGFPWLRRDGAAGHRVGGALLSTLAERTPLFLDRFGDGLSPRFRRAVETIPSWLPEAVERDPLPETLLHGDASPKNIFFPARSDREPVFFDWQLVRRGSARTDLRNLLVDGLAPGARATAELNVLEMYRESLSDRGVHTGREDLLVSYRIGALTGLVPCIGNGGLPGNHRRLRHAEALLERVPRALEELDAYSLITR